MGVNGYQNRWLPHSSKYLLMCAHVYISLGGPNVPTRIVKREITYIARTIQWPREGN